MVVGAGHGGQRWKLCRRYNDEHSGKGREASGVLSILFSEMRCTNDASISKPVVIIK